MTIKNLKVCLDNYNSSCLVRVVETKPNYPIGIIKNEEILKTVKHKQEISTVKDLMLELDKFKEKDKQISFCLNGEQHKIVKIKQFGLYIYIFVEPEEKYIITN